MTPDLQCVTRTQVLHSKTHVRVGPERYDPRVGVIVRESVVRDLQCLYLCVGPECSDLRSRQATWAPLRRT